MRESTKHQIEVRADLLQRVKADLITRLSLPFEPDDLHDDIPLLGSGLGLDSLDALEVILGIEQQFGVKVDEGNVSVLRSINSIVDYLQEQQGDRVADSGGEGAAASSSDGVEEYRLVRETLGVSRAQGMQLFLTEDEDAFFELDDVLAGNVANLRYGRVLHTFLADDDGQLCAEVYVANNDDEIIVLTEACVPASEITEAFAGTSLREVTDEYTVLSVDGPAAWSVPAGLLSREILGMPYLSVETHELDDVPLRILRAGKTGEFGYLAMVPAPEASQVWERFLEKAAEQGGGPCGADVFHLLKLDGRFHNIHREGRAVRDPLMLGLQWMIDLHKEQFRGREAILKRRAAGVPQRILGIALANGAMGAQPRAEVRCDGERCGEVLTSGFSHAMGQELSLVLMDRDAAYSGLDLEVLARDGEPLAARSISMPPFLTRSLSVKLEEV